MHGSGIGWLGLLMGLHSDQGGRPCRHFKRGSAVVVRLGKRETGGSRLFGYGFASSRHLIFGVWADRLLPLVWWNSAGVENTDQHGCNGEWGHGAFCSNPFCEFVSTVVTPCALHWGVRPGCGGKVDKDYEYTEQSEADVNR